MKRTFLIIGLILQLTVSGIAQQRDQQKQAAPQSEEAQFMNRLKELAKRQDDINERLKELQTALQEAIF